MLKRFLLLVVAGLMSVVLVACDEGEPASSGGNDEEKKEAEEKKEDKEKKYGLGDTAEVAGVKFTVKNVSLTDERNEFEENDPAKVVKIEYEIENGSDEEIPVGIDTQVYDGTGNQVEAYPLDNTMGSLKPGKKMQGVEHYGIEEGPIELYFQPMLSLDDAAVFELEVE